jgi:AraC-like DNA-binding protein
MKLRLAQNDGTQTYLLRAGMGIPEPMQLSHQHGDLELNYVYEGNVRYFMGGRFIALPERRLCAFWGAVPHQITEVSPNARFLWVCVPLVTLLRWNLGRPFLSSILSGGLVIDINEYRSDDELTQRWLEDLLSAKNGSWRTTELEVEARVRRLAFAQFQTARRKAEHIGQRHAEAIALYLSQHYAEDLRIADISKAVGLHPNTAMNVFRRECGMSIWQYVTRLRLAQAQLMLLSTDKTVLAVALESGFGSVARFYAAFTRECGLAPGEYRKQAV